MLVATTELQLQNGDCLSQAEFHEAYRLCPEGVKFELIGGTVYMASPLRRSHGNRHTQLSAVLELYESATPGAELLDNATTILGENSEPQPDLALRILSEYGGQSRETPDDYVQGAPEFIAEIAHSKRSIDLHQKRDDYQRAGVVEYLVLCLREKVLLWFHLKSRRRLIPDAEGVYRSRVFPGLWLDGPAFLNRQRARVFRVMEEGIASPAHVRFTRMLAARIRKHN
jgi:Uma2 family endonuclease